MIPAAARDATTTASAPRSKGCTTATVHHVSLSRQTAAERAEKRRGRKAHGLFILAVSVAERRSIARGSAATRDAGQADDRGDTPWLDRTGCAAAVSARRVPFALCLLHAGAAHGRRRRLQSHRDGTRGPAGAGAARGD